MSQGNSSIDVSVSQPRTGTEQHLAIQSLIRDGRSFSGRERNCCFLNTGGTRFADVSAVSGLDFPDDGRAAACVDWDHDGDLDLWLTNRNGPQVRLLRNDVATTPNSRSLAVRLVGRSCNRDAIGARLELLLGDPTAPRLVKTLRAGDGFLSQSSKWIHFGLGDAGAVDRLLVHWPGGAVEPFSGLAPGGRYRIVQGSGRAEPLEQTVRRIKLEPSPLQPAASSDAARIVLASPLPLPPLDFLSWEQRKQFLSPTGGRAILLNLWASWCPPCVSELEAFAQRHAELSAAGLNVLALSVDRADGQPSADRVAAIKLVNKLNLPFASGEATPGLVDKLQIVHDELFDRHLLLPLPTSVLIDAEGMLRAIYRGAADPDQLLADAASLLSQGEQLPVASVPFPGRWNSGPARLSLLPIFRQLLRRGHTDDAIEFAARHEERFPSEIASAELMTRSGNRLLEEGDLKTAETRFRRAIALDPKHAIAHAKLGVALERQERKAEAEAQYQEALRLAPQNETAHFALGLLLKSEGRTGESIAHFRHVLQVRPDYVPALFHLAQTLATDADPRNRNGIESVQWAEKAAEATGYSQPQVLDVLAAAQAEAGRFGEAVSTARRAIELARSRGEDSLADRIEQKLIDYQHQRPYHESMDIE